MKRTSWAISISGVAVAATALLATSCESPQVPACPGDRVATLQFHGQLVSADGGCPFPADAGLDFTATVAYTGEDSAVLCVSRPDAQPLAGTRSGDHLVVGSPAAAANEPACSCPVQVTETVEGDVQRDGGVVGFGGELRDAFAPASGSDPSTCGPATTGGGSGCGVPCELRWQLTATP